MYGGYDSTFVSYELISVSNFKLGLMVATTVGRILYALQAMNYKFTASLGLFFGNTTVTIFQYFLEQKHQKRKVEIRTPYRILIVPQILPIALFVLALGKK